MDDQVAQTIGYFRVENMSGQQVAGDTSTAKRTSMVISLVTGSPISISTMQNAILDYVNSRPYIKSAKEGERIIYETKIKFIDGELRRLDSLKDTYNRFLANSKISYTVYNNVINPADVYKSADDLMKEKTELIEWYSKDQKALSLIDGFKDSGVPSSMSLSTSLILYSIISVSFALLVAFTLELRRRLLS